jgi:sodium-dependent dicarboxylate transporter 2/3/5
MQTTKKIGLLLGPIIFFIIQFLPITLVSVKGDAVIAVAIWMVSGGLQKL